MCVYFAQRDNLIRVFPEEVKPKTRSGSSILSPGNRRKLKQIAGRQSHLITSGPFRRRNIRKEVKKKKVLRFSSTWSQILNSSFPAEKSTRPVSLSCEEEQEWRGWVDKCLCLFPSSYITCRVWVPIVRPLLFSLPRVSRSSAAGEHVIVSRQHLCKCHGKDKKRCAWKLFCRESFWLWCLMLGWPDFAHSSWSWCALCVTWRSIPPCGDHKVLKDKPYSKIQKYCFQIIIIITIILILTKGQSSWATYVLSRYLAYKRSLLWILSNVVKKINKKNIREYYIILVVPWKWLNIFGLMFCPMFCLKQVHVPCLALNMYM